MSLAAVRHTFLSDEGGMERFPLSPPSLVGVSPGAA